MNLDNILNDDYFKIQDELKEIHLEMKKLNEEVKAFVNSMNTKKQALKEKAEKLLLENANLVGKQNKS